MRYRPEIDGLRALAVVPVVFCHASMPLFSGGFIGVDIFFVISGYLITSILLEDLDKNRYSIIHFYERRARRIIPALYFVIFCSLPFGALWMMPDELKNFGQSITATALFSNNLLLTLTSDYWALASEFKPLLHTWSLGVEEQYYLLFPSFLSFLYRRRAHSMPLVLATLLFSSLVLAAWATRWIPSAAFYVLPTRCWEILLGALAAYRLAYFGHPKMSAATYQLLSLSGLLLIIISVVFFSESVLSPGPFSLIPTVGSVLIIMFATDNNFVCRILSTKYVVLIGLISYSLYLWHQPLFAFARVFSEEPPTIFTRIALICASGMLAFLTWRYVEAPFRDKKRVSQSAVAYLSLIGTLAAIGVGAFLHLSYGMSWRVFNGVSVSEMDKKLYNRKAFEFKTDYFQNNNDTRLLIVGNSFGRDFVNMTVETFGLDHLSIVYRDDLHDCIFNYSGHAAGHLFKEADIIVFASGEYHEACVKTDTDFAERERKWIFYTGTKDFGYNLNWLIRLDEPRRRNRYNRIPDEVSRQEDWLKTHAPSRNFIPMLGAVERNGYVPITDDLGRMLSTDRSHVTRYGAIYFGNAALLNSQYGKLLSEITSGHGVRRPDGGT